MSQWCVIKIKGGGGFNLRQSEWDHRGISIMREGTEFNSEKGGGGRV